LLSAVHTERISAAIAAAQSKLLQSKLLMKQLANLLRFGNINRISLFLSRYETLLLWVSWLGEAIC
jgi:hypothetical protein